jgi:hypothetical protein
MCGGCTGSGIARRGPGRVRATRADGGSMTEKKRPPLVARPEAGVTLDPAELHARTMKRFPKIMAKLHEYELREEREKRKPD